MRTNEWGKTLLYVYKYLDRITDGIDKMVDQAAMNSFYYNSNSLKENNVLSLSKKIIDMIERKKRLVNIKVLVDKCLLACDEISGIILIEKYIDNLSCDDIAKRLGLNERTYYRKQENAEVKFYKNMAMMGYDEKRLKDYLAEERWIIEVYENFVKENEEERELA